MSARIYKPVRNAMQSGQKNSKKWYLEFEPEPDSRFIEPVMGWASSSDMLSNQVKLVFSTKKEAIDYAKRNDLEYDIVEYKEKAEKIQAYSDNFKN